MQMKKGLFLIILSLLGLLDLHAQTKPDTVEVSGETATYIITDSNIEVFQIGNGSKQFIGAVNPSAPATLFLKAKTPGKPATLFFKLVSGEQYTFFLKYSKTVKEPFIDLRSNQVNQAKSTGNRQQSAQQKKANRQSKLEILQSLKGQDIKTVGAKNTNVVVALRNLRIDGDNLYLKFRLSNRGAIDYKTSYVSFQLVERGGKGIAPISTDLEPTKAIEATIVKGKNKGEFSYSLPLSSISGDLEITFRETGARTVKVVIPTKLINRAKPI